MTDDKRLRGIAVNFMVDYELHAICRESENLDGCDIFEDLIKALLSVREQTIKDCAEICQWQVDVQTKADDEAGQFHSKFILKEILSLLSEPEK